MGQETMGPPEHLKRICDNSGMPMVVYTAAGSPENRESENIERNKRRMDFAAAMEVDCFMYMSGRRPENSNVSRDEIKRAAEDADTWAEYASGYGLELSYHIHTNMLVDSIEEWRLYMNCLEKSKLCIDVSHAELWGYDPVQAIEDFRDRLNYIHFQDYSSCTVRERGKYNPTWVPVGEAECLDFAGVLRKLEEIGYDRWVTSCPGTPPRPANRPSKKHAAVAGCGSICAGSVASPFRDRRGYFVQPIRGKRDCRRYTPRRFRASSAVSLLPPEQQQRSRWYRCRRGQIAGGSALS